MKFYLHIPLIILNIYFSCAFAQDSRLVDFYSQLSHTENSSPLYLNNYETQSSTWKIGLGGGVSMGFVLGNYTDPGTFCDYNFSAGNIKGFNGNVAFTAPIGSSSELYFTIGYQANTIDSKNELNKLKAVRAEPELIPVLIEGNLKLNLDVVYFEYFLKQKMFGRSFFVLIGGKATYNLKNQMEITETIIDKGFLFLSTHSNSDILYPQSKIPKINMVNIYAGAGFGFDILIKKKFVLSPQLILSFPFINMTTNNSFKIINTNINLQLMYVL